MSDQPLPVAEAAQDRGQGDTPPNIRRRRVWLIGLVAWTIVAAGSGIGAATLLRSPAEVAAETATPELPPPSVEVIVGSLGSDVTATGAVVDTGTTVSRTGTLTGEAAANEVAEGQSLLEVDGRPVILFAGQTVGYRDLGGGTVGSDVRAVQTSLRDLGLYENPVDGRYGEGTARAVERLYAGLGYAPPAPETTVEEVEGATLALQAAELALKQAPSSPDEEAVLARRQAQLAVRVAAADLAATRMAALTPLPINEYTFHAAPPVIVAEPAGAAEGEVSVRIVGNSDSLPVLLTVPQSIASQVEAGASAGITVGGTEEQIPATVEWIAPIVGNEPIVERYAVDGQLVGEGQVGIEVQPDRPIQASGGDPVTATIQTEPTSDDGVVVPSQTLGVDTSGQPWIAVAESESGPFRRQDVTVVQERDGRTLLRPWDGFSGSEFVQIRSSS